MARRVDQHLYFLSGTQRMQNQFLDNGPPTTFQRFRSASFIVNAIPQTVSIAGPEGSFGYFNRAWLNSAVSALGESPGLGWRRDRIRTICSTTTGYGLSR
jgi:hypothetical protein